MLLVQRKSLKRPIRFGARMVITAHMLAILLVMVTGCSAPNAITRANTTAHQPVRQLIFYGWFDNLPASVLEQFRVKYGIEVILEAYESQEAAVSNLYNGKVYDIVDLDNRFIPQLIRDHLLAEIDLNRVDNIKNIFPSFRNLQYDPQNEYTIPYTWGTTGLVVRTDLVGDKVTTWKDLWNPALPGMIGIWKGESRETLGMALRALGYSANTENPEEIKQAFEYLQELKPRAVIINEDEVSSVGPMLAQGKISIAVGYVFDAMEGSKENPNVKFIFPSDGGLLWGENLVIPANSPHKQDAELFLNFLLEPHIGAAIANYQCSATTNEAAYQYVDEAQRNNRAIYPLDEDLKGAEIILPVSKRIEELIEQYWKLFVLGL